MKQNLILASGSPRRRELLALLGAEFTVIPADIDESLCENAPLDEEIVRLALDKACTICAMHGGTVIGADTLVVLEGEALGKPKDANDAQRMLWQLSGKTHEVLTALAVVSDDGTRVSMLSRTLVTFYALAEDEIARYVATGEPLDKAGAYGIQGCGATLVRKIEGDFYSVMGLPVAELCRILRARGII